MKALRAVLTGLAAAGSLALGLACLALSVYTWGGRITPRLDALANFAPLYLAGGLVAALVALFVPMGWLRLALALPGLAAVAGAGALMWPELTRPMSPRAPADAPHQLKLIQFNTWADNVDPEATGRWIAEQDADVVVIEEPRSAIVKAILRERHYYVTGPKASVMIFSRAKPLDTPYPWPRPQASAPLMRAEFAPEDGGYTIIGVHLTWPTQWWYHQMQNDDTAYVVHLTDPRRTILVGDFNSTPWSFSRRREDRKIGLERRTHALFSWPARNVAHARWAMPFPFLPIDHIYAGSDWRTVSIKRGPRLGSDHYPVIITLALMPS